MAAGAVLLAAVAAVIAIAFFSSRDDATVDRDDGPGRERRADATPRVRPGNVVLLHRAASAARPLRALAEETAGPSTPELEAAGQAVIVRRDPRLDASVRALSATRSLDVGGPGDERLRGFVEFWLGRDA